MTSKLSFSKLTIDELKKFTWLTAIQFLVFGFLIPIRMVVCMARYAIEVVRYGASPDYFRIFSQNAGIGKVENTVCIMLCGIVAALCVFSYLYSSAKLDFWHSIPVRRTSLFGVKYVAGTLTFVFAYILNQILAVMIGAFYDAVNAAMLYEMALASVQGILFFLCSFSGTLIAIMLTGKLLTSVFAIFALEFYVPVLYFLGKVLEAVFLPARLDSGELVGADWLWYTSPWSFCMGMEIKRAKLSVLLIDSDKVMPKAGELGQLIASAALCTVIALFLYQIRKTEAAGKAVAFEQTEGLVKLLFSIPITLYAALFVYEVLESPVMTVIFTLLAGALCCMIMEFIYRLDIHQVLNGKRYILITYAVSAMIFLFFYQDLAGINTYLPAKDEIASMAVCDTNTRYGRTMQTEVNGYEAAKKRLTLLETEEFDDLYEIAQNGILYTGQHRDADQKIMMVYMKYRLKNGKEIYRNYWVENTLLFDAMDRLVADEKMKELYFDILTWNAQTLTDVDASCWLTPEDCTKQMDVHLDFSASQVRNVIEAYQKDLKDLTYREYYNASSNLTFFDRDSYGTIGVYNVGKAFPETIKLLNQIHAENQ